MVSLFAFYRRPADESAFLSHYENTHVPLVLHMPGLLEMQWGVPEGLGRPDRSDGWFLVAEMRFSDKAALTTALNSAEGKAAGTDLKEFGEKLVTMRTVEWR